MYRNIQYFSDNWADPFVHSIPAKELLGYNQCDQIGRFMKLLGDKSSYKSSPNIWEFWALFRSTSL